MDSRLFTWTLILIGVILLASVAVALFRRYYFQSDDFPREGFSLEELQQLRASGQMSAEEFAKARAAIAGQLRGDISKKSPAESAASSRAKPRSH
ncbi:MAG TPA: hypothetical protein VGG19_19155 [Tepidisphaeraceae bacterium]|jgi:hypothetical protein